MRKTWLVIVLTAALLLAWGIMPAGAAQSDELAWKTGPGSTWTSFTFVGDIQTSLSGDILTVRYVARPGYMLAETHLAVASSLGLIPHTKGGPTPGQFEFGEEYDPLVSEDTFLVDVSDIPGNIYILAHAVVVRTSDGKRETAWGTGCTEPVFHYPGKNWARFFIYYR